MDNLKYIPFRDVNFNDSFFDSLKSDYQHGFIEWVNKKINDTTQFSYVLFDENNKIDGFMYLKIEMGIVNDVTPNLSKSKHLKIGTFKFNPRGTLRGQRFIKKVFDHAINEKVDDIYVTIFDKHQYLIKLFIIYGFQVYGSKPSKNGKECVLVREMKTFRLTTNESNCLINYPYIINSSSYNKYLLSIYPEFHTRLFPDSKLVNESPDILKDVSHSNSIRKIYICAISNALKIRTNDQIVIYRTTDSKGPAHYRSVVTSICIVESVTHINSFQNEDDFVNFCKKYSVFSEEELRQYYKLKRYPYVISFTYNLALPKRITRATLIEVVGLNPDERWSIIKLTDEKFNKIIELSNVDESIIINKT
ncbi:hypothetical protein Xmau_00299 [Xenorhabdus mauleonii]|uniref:Acetyltransferase (GNAT) domain-containing protein n=1 Tax=Xenorhabdus mauleonii TaxID=351675 RepID=A0A1I3U8J8_9GAMM|nr:N-acetyltransferase [Xenorhabdus mauleonii]PHM45908.1 hypothetical protein Xmau_00299 [Xenorhabdus mauleonii]SFJ78107.1 hypothetical protein SAMN05421680_11614 [Xenorhabdus mauleonii]